MRPILAPAVAALLLAVAACAAVAPPASGPASAQPEASDVLPDVYAIAHGMALGYLMSGAARPETVAELARLDARAGSEMRALGQSPSSFEQRRATASAVSALADFEERMAIADR
ncbi:MAG TPA: hypothetical protein VHY76_05085 [Acetobacteraceae bacterium]|nr:hypothetical protein [Acetobacteraceae bacterium]